MVESRRHLHPVADRLCLKKAALGLKQLGDRVAVDVLHDDVGAPFVDPHVVHRNDVRMLELRYQPRFAPRHFACLRTILPEELDRHPAPKPLVFGQPHLRHAAGTDKPLQAISLVNNIGGVHGV